MGWRSDVLSILKKLSDDADRGQQAAGNGILLDAVKDALLRAGINWQDYKEERRISGFGDRIDEISQIPDIITWLEYNFPVSVMLDGMKRQTVMFQYNSLVEYTGCLLQDTQGACRTVSPNITRIEEVMNAQYGIDPDTVSKALDRYP